MTEEKKLVIAKPEDKKTTKTTETKGKKCFCLSNRISKDEPSLQTIIFDSDMKKHMPDESFQFVISDDFTIDGKKDAEVICKVGNLGGGLTSWNFCLSEESQMKVKNVVSTAKNSDVLPEPLDFWMTILDCVDSY